MHRKRLVKLVAVPCLAAFYGGLIQAQTPLAIATAVLPPASTGVGYSTMLQAMGGTGSYTWSVTTGTLPLGLSLNALSGNITGVPMTTVLYPGVSLGAPHAAVTGTQLVFQVQDSSGATASANLPISVAAPVAISTNALPPGTAGVPYSFCVLAQGGDPNGDWSWTVTAGALPPELSLTFGVNCPILVGAHTVIVAGTPMGAGSFPFTLQVNDADGRTAQQSYTIAINPVETQASSEALTLTPASLSFTAQAGGGAPPSQTALVALSGGTSGFSAAVTQGASWLSVSPAAATSPATLTVAVNSAGLSPGPYSGVIAVTAPASSNSPQMLGVTLTVVAATPTISSVVNGASLQAEALAAGAIVTIKGAAMGPATGVSMQPDAKGNYATSLAGVQVLFGGIAGPMLYAQSSQINAVAPFGIGGAANTTVEVAYNNVNSAPYSLAMQPAAPGLFTADSSGTGQGAILNQDSTANSDANPAAPGTTVALFGAGGGLFQAAMADGTAAGKTNLALPVSAQIGGVNATVSYAGSAPGLVAGVVQINVTIPLGTPAGDVPVAIFVNGVASQAAVTLAVR